MSQINYVAYYRVSTVKQGKAGLGMQAQKQAISEFLRQHNGILVAEYTEVGSGKASDRPEFERAVEYAQLANAVLLVAKLDRLSRDLHFITDLQKKGVRFKLADFPDIDQLTIHILAAMAQHEAQMISQRTKAALSAAKLRGVRLGNPQLERCRNTDTVSATQARTSAQGAWRQKIIKVIHHLQAQYPQANTVELAHLLNQRGLCSYRNKPFSSAIVSRLLRQA